MRAEPDVRECARSVKIIKQLVSQFYHHGRSCHESKQERWAQKESSPLPELMLMFFNLFKSLENLFLDDCFGVGVRS